MTKFNICIIGAGNVGWHLANVLEDAGHNIMGVYSRTPAHVAQLVDSIYDANVLESLDLRGLNCEVVIVTVPDDTIKEIAEQLWIDENTCVFHTSASQPKEALQWASSHYGVFYPLQTFTKGRRLDFSNIPICIDVSTELAKDVAVQLGSSISNQVYELSQDQRKMLHLSAVFACNFVNYLYAISNTILEGEGLSFSFLHNLIKETADKAIALGTEDAQTGPALRKDFETMKTHLELLAANPELAALYKTLSEGIMTSFAADKNFKRI